MPVQAVYQRLDGRLVQMPKIGSGLSRLLTQHHGLWVNKPENAYGVSPG